MSSTINKTPIEPAGV